MTEHIHIHILYNKYVICILLSSVLCNCFVLLLYFYAIHAFRKGVSFIIKANYYSIIFQVKNN